MALILASDFQLTTDMIHSTIVNSQTYVSVTTSNWLSHSTITLWQQFLICAVKKLFGLLT